MSRVSSALQLIAVTGFICSCSSNQGGNPGGAGGAGGGAPPPDPVENSGTACTIPAAPSYSDLPINTKLPDPFLSMSGARISAMSDWTCRRAEIAAQIQTWELGPKPPAPAMVSGAVSDTSVDVTASDGTTTVTFSAAVSLPPTGQPPYPAIIGFGGGSLNSAAIQNLGVAIINFNNDEIGAQQDATSRGM